MCLAMFWTILGGVCFLVLVVIVHGLHEQRVTRRAVAGALHGRALTTDQEFARLFDTLEMGQIAARVRRLLADNLSCDLSGLIPGDDFEKWLSLFPGLDSAVDSFFEEPASEFQLTRECPWPERFGSFDALVRFVAAHAQAAPSE